MREEFAAYYQLTEEEFKTLFEEGLIVVDANVLLNLYRYPEGARGDLLKALEKVSDRLWIPHYAALEYQRNRLTVVSEQKKRFREVRDIINKNQSTL